MEAQRWAALTAAAILAMALGTVGAACGADDDGAIGADRSSTTTSVPARVDTTASTANDGSTTPPPESTDGRLTTPDDEVVTDYGELRDRQAAVRTLDRLQREFRAGRMASACKSISEFQLSQFIPPGTQSDTPCRDKLEAYATQRSRHGDRPQPMRLLWVRSYADQAGIWVNDARGHPLRIQLSRWTGNDGWQLDLGALDRPDILAMTLTGAETYGRR